MRMRLRTAAVLAIASTIVVGVVAPAAAATPTDPTWSVDLAAAKPAGVRVVDGTVRLVGHGAFRAPAGGSAGPAPLLPTGLLTFATHTLRTATDRVGTRIDGGDAGSTVDVRGRRSNGNWSEWIPAAGDGTVTLPEPVTQVQGRLVLTDAAAAVHGVVLSALPTTARSEGTPDTHSAPVSSTVFATREGLVGGTTANGHVIGDHDHFVALPSRRALSADQTSDYSVKVCAPNGKCAFAPVWDVGPWNTQDDYWNAPADREQWGDLPQGMPEAQAAFEKQYNDGKDQFDRSVRNPAGLDLGDGVFWDALGLTDNSFVTVDYLWTGSAKLSKVVGDAPAQVLAAPDPAAQVVGSAAEDADVPVQCSLSSPLGSFLQIGAG